MTQLTANSNTESRSAGLPVTHCVFRCGTTLFALPAVSIREVLQRPAIVPVPGTPSMFAGLCHIRSEFIPVIKLDPILSRKKRCTNEILLILEDEGGYWAVLVDQVSSLRVLEISDAPETENEEDEWSATVIGWATEGNYVIQVLDPQRIGRLARKELSIFRESVAQEPRRAERNA